MDKRINIEISGSNGKYTVVITDNDHLVCYHRKITASFIGRVIAQHIDNMELLETGKSYLNSESESLKESSYYMGFDISEIFVPGKYVTVQVHYSDDNDSFTEIEFCAENVTELADLWEEYCDENGVNQNSVISFTRVYRKEDEDEYGDDYFSKDKEF